MFTLCLVQKTATKKENFWIFYFMGVCVIIKREHEWNYVIWKRWIEFFYFFENHIIVWRGEDGR